MRSENFLREKQNEKPISLPLWRKCYTCMKGQETYKVSNLDMNSTYFTIPSLSIGTFLRNKSNSWSDMFSSNLPSMAARNCCWVRSPESLRSMLLKKKKHVVKFIQAVRQVTWEARWPHVQRVHLWIEWSGFESWLATSCCVHTVPLSTQVYKWAQANLMLEVTLRWTSIPSRKSRNIPRRFMLLKP